MDDQEETLVLNYVDEDFGAPAEAHTELNGNPRLDGSFDENQNTKVDVKEGVVKASPHKTRNLKVILEKKELASNKLKFSTQSNKQNSITSDDSAMINVKKRKKERGSAEDKNIPAAETPNGIKLNGLKSSVLKNLGCKNVPPKNPISKNAINGALSNNIDDTVIKVENDDDLDVPTIHVINTQPNALREPEDLDVKYETVQQIHTEFKYESLSETEENIRKKQQAINCDAKRNNFPKTQKKLQVVAGQTTLESLFKVVDLKLKCKLPATSIFKCKHCLYVGNSKANLERHMLIHMDPNDILWYRCTECEYKSKYEHQLKSHTLIHKNPDDILYFQCPHCDLKCSRKHNLTNHIRSIHSNRVNSLRCADCDYSTFSKDRLVAHVKKHSKEVFTCNLCKFVTKRKEYLQSHFKFKHTEVARPFPCDTCSYKGKSKRELNRHYDRMHNKEKLHEYKCNNCDFTSIYKKNLEFHLLHMHQNSEGFQKFICGHCRKEFSYKNGLKTHIIRIHLKLTEEDWHKCQECKYKCKDVNTLKRHIKRNHGAPRLHCKECSFATNRQKSMIAHMKTHEVDADSILKCPECPYRIIQAVSFVYHMKVLHGKPISSKDIHKYYLRDD